MKKSHRVAHEKSEAWWVLLLLFYNFYCGCQDSFSKKNTSSHYLLWEGHCIFTHCSFLYYLPVIMAGDTHSRRNAAAPAAIFLCAECVPPQFPSSDHRTHRVLIFLKFPVGTVHRMSRRRLMVGRLFALAVLVDGRVIVDFLSLFLRHRIRLRNGR